MTQPDDKLTFPEALLAIATSVPWSTGARRAAVIEAICEEFGLDDPDDTGDAEPAAPVLRPGESLNPVLDAALQRQPILDIASPAEKVSDLDFLPTRDLEAELARRKAEEA